MVCVNDTSKVNVVKYCSGQRIECASNRLKDWRIDGTEILADATNHLKQGDKNTNGHAGLNGGHGGPQKRHSTFNLVRNWSKTPRNVMD